ncbi:MAG: hypothetical protein JRN34_04710 [Nitrososphaerota archaeon]|jgi:hypothetical protein|nr:hypothetical protein [Nitrososphaerota archaeon]MDG6942209.1 hypothetical protein [Nitrososphaerota archaeon]MDG6942674.1 hypothetical protein [Nitrososphaerota archaeon]MDG6948461.1 hypothetical protein [Nitrososphaerota archaeon]MDG6950387.1 hypothetical protein [Nitrososphaerota archaeon]
MSFRIARAVEIELEAESDSMMMLRVLPLEAEVSLIPLGAPSLSGARTDARLSKVCPSVQPANISTLAFN